MIIEGLCLPRPEPPDPDCTMTPRQFNDIFLPHHRSLFGLALTILQDEREAADCVQDAFTRLWEKRRELTGVENHKAYAVATVRNLALSVLRAKGRNRFSAEGIPEDTMAADRSPHERAETRDDLGTVARLLARLPENQRRVIMMTAAAGLTTTEISLATGLSDDNVRVLLSRGRKKLRELFARHNTPILKTEQNN